MARLKRCLFVLCLWLAAAACTSLPNTSTPATQASPTPLNPASPTPPVRSLSPTVTRQPTATIRRTPTPTPTPEDTGWRSIAPGVEWRYLQVDIESGRENLQLVRLDPQQVRLRVVYEPAHPRPISQWAASLPNALVVVNAGYFAPDNQVTGLIISAGIVRGHSYGDYAGMLAVHTDGQVTLRWLRTWPYRPTERLAEAVQSFPVLVKPGGQMGFPPDADQGQRSRRTVVGLDTSGRIILLACPGFHFSLHELAVWLVESDLDLDIAMNLDGGTSTGLWISNHQNNIDSHIPVPAVIVVEPADQ